MKGESQIKIDFDTEQDAQSALLALKREEEFKKRSVSNISVQGSTLVIDIEAEDIVSLRATVNSYLRYLQVFESINGGNEDE